LGGARLERQNRRADHSAGFSDAKRLNEIPFTTKEITKDTKD
jgi:hypothetical protein